MSTYERLDPFGQWMVRANLTHIREGTFTREEIVANLRAQGYDRVADAIEEESA